MTQILDIAVQVFKTDILIILKVLKEKYDKRIEGKFLKQGISADKKIEIYEKNWMEKPDLNSTIPNCKIPWVGLRADWR